MRKWIGLLCLLAASGAAGWMALAPPPTGGGLDAGMTIWVPELDAIARAGERIYAEHCRACHGDNASGSDRGPPLVHMIYGRVRLPDAGFVLASRRGAKSRYWSFGDMPATVGLTEGEALRILAYVRSVQAANGVN